MTGYQVLDEFVNVHPKTGVKYTNLILNAQPDNKNINTRETVLIDGKEYAYTVASTSNHRSFPPPPVIYFVINYEGSLIGKTVYFKY